MSVDLDKLEEDAFLARAETLAILVAHPAYQTYADLLREMRAASLEQMAVANRDDVPYWQGVVGTLANIIDRPGRVIQTAATLQRAEEDDKGVVRQDIRAILGMGIDHDETL